MKYSLSGLDIAALSPFIIILVTSLLVLIIESFSSKAARKWTLAITLIGILAAILCTLYVPASHNTLLTAWLSFDSLSHLFLIFFLFIGICCALLASSFFYTFSHTQGEYYFLLLSCIFGLMLIGSSNDFLTLFLGIETLSIALYVLCTYMKQWTFSNEAAIKYFFIGSVGSAFLLFGIALIYGAVGTTQFATMLKGYQALSMPSAKILFLSGIAFLTVGLAFKAAIFPFHVWAPDVYDGASNPVTAFMAVGTKVGAFAAFVRVFFVALPQFDPIWNEGISFLAYPTLIWANFVAIRQVKLRRFFAYSGISHAGFLLIPLAVGTPEALVSLNFYLIVYALATLGVFSILAVLDDKPEGVTLNDLNGLFRRSPVMAGLMSLCILTLAGIPPTAGFFAKFYIFKYAVEAGFYTLVIVGLLATIISAYYYLRIISVMFTEASAKEKAPYYIWSAAAVSVIAFAGIVLLSIFPGSLIGFLE